MRAIFPVLLLPFAFACGGPADAPVAERLPAAASGPPLPLVMTAPPLIIKGQTASVRVTGARPGAVVALVGSVATSGAGACPAAIAPECLSIPGPIRVLGTRAADPAGQAFFSVLLPPSFPFQAVRLQAASKGGGQVYLSTEAAVPADLGGNDYDGDGLSNEDELNRTRTNPVVADTDADGLDDGAEIALGTDPRDADSDDDGLPDGEEVDIGSDPLRVDTDGDTLSDFDEVRQTGTSPIRADTDGDGLNDDVELAETNTNPLIADTDGDRLLDGEEVLLGTNPLVFDTDGDGLTDGDEVLDQGTNHLDPDSDNDGLTDGFEVNTYLTSPLNPDTDADGLNDGREFNAGSDPFDPDSDDDGLLDGDEVVYSTNLLRADTDGDGLTDGDEVHLYGCNPLLVDTDGGGIPDGTEVAQGKDPNNPADDTAGTVSFILSEVCDHAINTGARFVEIYNAGTAAGTLDGYALQRYSNGGTTPTNIAIPTGVVVPPHGFYVVANSTGFTTTFGVAPDQISASVNGNGDDVYALARAGTVVDVFGVIGVAPAAGTAWNYLDGGFTRALGVTAPTATFNLAEWVGYTGAGPAAPYVR